MSQLFRELDDLHGSLGDDVDLAQLAAATEGWTGAGLELACKKAVLEALEEYRAAASGKLLVSHRHLWEAQCN